MDVVVEFLWQVYVALMVVAAVLALGCVVGLAWLLGLVYRIYGRVKGGN